MIREKKLGGNYTEMFAFMPQNKNNTPLNTNQYNNKIQPQALLNIQFC